MDVSRAQLNVSRQSANDARADRNTLNAGAQLGGRLAEKYADLPLAEQARAFYNDPEIKNNPDQRQVDRRLRWILAWSIVQQGLGWK